MNLGLGCVNLGSAGAGRSIRHDVRLVHEALHLGVRVFDTADAYGSGASERVLGKALRHRRDEVHLATKGGYLFRERTAAEHAARRLAGAARRRLPSRSGAGASPSTGGEAYRSQDFSPHHLRRAVEGSLRRLRTDHIDLYQLHGPTALHPALFDELGDLSAVGKVRAFGIGAESVDAAIGWLGVPDVGCVQIPFGVLDPEAAVSLFPQLDRRPVDVWARGVLGGGLLGLAERDPRALAGDPKAPVVDALSALAGRTGIGLDQLAISFVRSFAAVAVVLVGISSSAHLRRNVELMSAPLPTDDVRDALLRLAGDGDACA